MFKTVLFPIAITACLLNGCDIRKQDQAAKPALPKKIIENPTTVQMIDSVYDFGSIKEGETVEHSFTFKNTGNKPLVISKASATCGCTVAEKPEKPIAPGETGVIKATFNSDKKPGEAHKTVTVTSNADPAFPTLLIKGTVIGKTE